MKSAALALALALAAACGPSVEWVARTTHRDKVQVVHDDGQWCVEVFAAEPHRRCHDALAIESLVVRAQGVAYAARDADEWRVYSARTSGPPRLEPTDARGWRGIAEVQMTSEGRPVYTAEDRHGWWLQVGDQTQGPWPAIFEGSLRVSPQDSIACVVAAADGGPMQRVMHDGASSRAWDGVGHLRYLSDGRLLYAGRRGSELFVVLDGERYGPYRRIEAHIENGPSAGWTALRDDGWVAVVDGETLGPFIEVRDLMLDRRPEGLTTAFIAKDDDGERVLIDGAPGPAFAAVEHLALLEPGRPVYAARVDDTWTVTDGVRRFGPFGEVIDVAGGGGRWAAVIAAEEAVEVWVDGALRSKAEWVTDLHVRENGVAYLAGRGDQRAVVVDEVAYRFGSVMESTLVLSADGRHWGCVVLEADGSRPRIVVDGVREYPLPVDELASATAGRDRWEILATGGVILRAHVRRALERSAS